MHHNQNYRTKLHISFKMYEITGKKIGETIYAKYLPNFLNSS
jgi:hypothetical protein